jgi:hypothetical protein
LVYSRFVSECTISFSCANHPDFTGSENHMPMIDVYTPADLFPSGTDRQLVAELTTALLRAEGVTTPSPAHLANTAAYIHRLPPAAVNTAGTGSARVVRIQVLNPSRSAEPG